MFSAVLDKSGPEGQPEPQPENAAPNPASSSKKSGMLLFMIKF